jgi:hypothetical protein
MVHRVCIRLLTSSSVIRIIISETKIVKINEQSNPKMKYPWLLLYLFT